jgi:hypothetical protein
VSLSDTTRIAGILLLREITRQLTVWDTGARSVVVLEPGTVISGCRIHRNHEDGEPYVVEFQFSGRLYSCPLFRFQPRTQSILMAGSSGSPVREAAAN